MRLQAIPSKSHSDNGPEILVYVHCRVAFSDPKVFSTGYIRTIVTKNIVFHVDALMS